MSFTRFLNVLLITSLAVVSVGCQHSVMRETENVPETIAKRGGVKVNILASSKMNTDQNGKAHAVRLKVYQLSNRANFISADYRELANQDFLVLGDSLVRQTEVTVKPGQQLSLALDQNITGRYVGVVAMFSHPDGENWRVISPVTSTSMNITLEQNQIFLN